MMSNLSVMKRSAVSLLSIVSLFAVSPVMLGQSTQRDLRPVVAASSPKPGKRLALVIGNGNYMAYGKLPNAINDAEDLASMLRQVGFQVQLERDVSTAEALDGAIQRFTNQLQAGDLALFYYAGHGAQIDRDQRPNYLVPVGFQGRTMADLREHGYLASRAIELLEDSRATLRLVILDACRNNPFTRGRSAGGYRTLSPPAAIQRGTLVAYAARETQVAIDSGPNGRNGLFTYHLIRELQRPGVDLLDAIRNVADAVNRDSAESQSPVYYGHYSGRYYLVPSVSESRPLPSSFDRAQIFATARTLYLAQRYTEALPLLSQAAEAGHVPAMAYLGLMYNLGLGGLIINEAEAVRWYRKGAEAGDGKAMAELGIMYLFGNGGLSEDEVEAVRWFRKGVAAGDGGAMAQLGQMYDFGRGGLSKDKAEAVRWYRKGAAAGDGFAMAQLGSMYFYGEGGVAKDQAEAARWYRKGAEAGSSMAMVDLGNMYYYGQGGLSRDVAEAVRWHRRAADAGNVQGMAFLGVRYREGQGGLQKDEAEAVRWFRQAADIGDRFAMVKLGIMYEDGRGGLTKDEVEAVRWYRKAADAGDAEGMVNLGLMYEDGRGGLTKDEREAVAWYRKAADMGFGRGLFLLGSSYETGRGGLTRNEVEAARLYREGADQDDVLAMFNLGRMYEQGRGGLSRNEPEAVRWYRKAAAAGSADAKKALNRLSAAAPR